MPYEMVRLLNSDHPYRYDGTLFGGNRLWTPSQILTSLWLDADSPSSITLNGSTVSQWNDKSGNGRNAIQGVTAYQPAYVQAAINDKPAIVTDGVDDALFVASWGVISQPITRVFVLNPVTIKTATIANSANIDVPSASASNFSDFTDGTNQMSQYAGSTSNTAIVSANSNYIRVSEFSTANSRVYMNGTVIGPSNVGSNTLNGLCIGAYSTTGSGAGVGASSIRFGEILIIPSILSTDNRQRLEGYLAWKWKLEGSLPANHPYKNYPPLV